MSASPLAARPVRVPRPRAHAVLVPTVRDSAAAAVSSHPIRGDTIAIRGRTLEGLGTLEPDRRSALVATLLAHVPRADRAAAQTAIPAILDAARKAGASDPNRIGYLLATAQTESDFGANMTESGHSAAWFNRTYGGADGNRAGTSDGYAYRGRGYVQTTHAGRYAELSHCLGLPDVQSRDHGRPALDGRGHPIMIAALVAYPEKVAQPALAAEALVIGVQRNLFTRNPATAIETTIPTGQKPGAVDFYHARGIVNGIVKAQALAIASQATAFAQILQGYRHSVLGVPPAK